MKKFTVSVLEARCGTSLPLTKEPRLKYGEGYFDRFITFHLDDLMRFDGTSSERNSGLRHRDDADGRKKIICICVSCQERDKDDFRTVYLILRFNGRGF